MNENLKETQGGGFESEMVPYPSFLFGFILLKNSISFYISIYLSGGRILYVHCFLLFK